MQRPALLSSPGAHPHGSVGVMAALLAVVVLAIRRRLATVGV